MSKKNEIVRHHVSPQRTILAGVAIGAFTGMLGAYLINRRAQRMKKDQPLNVSEALKLGLLIFGLLRAIAALKDD
jgi:NhaP-type Na+/H+ and K+/H+ antiporter